MLLVALGRKNTGTHITYFSLARVTVRILPVVLVTKVLIPGTVLVVYRYGKTLTSNSYSDFLVKSLMNHHLVSRFCSKLWYLYAYVPWYFYK